MAQEQIFVPGAERLDRSIMLINGNPVARQPRRFGMGLKTRGYERSAGV